MRHETQHRTQGVPLCPADRAHVLALVQRDGEPATLARLGVARATLARCAAGLPVQRATAECVARRLNEAQDTPGAEG